MTYWTAERNAASSMQAFIDRLTGGSKYTAIDVNIQDGASLVGSHRRIHESWKPRFFKPPEGWRLDERSVFEAVRGDVERYARGEKQAGPRGLNMLKLMSADNGVLEVRACVVSITFE